MRIRSLTAVFIFALLILTAGCANTAPSSGGTATPTLSESSATPEDIVTFVSNAVIYTQRVGKTAALREFSDRNGSFTRRELYVWAYDFNGTNLAHPYHPEYLGQNKLNLTDATGVRMVEAMRDAARNGSGFVTYAFENPVRGTTEPKLAYVKKVDDTWWLASGIYESDVSFPHKSPDIVRQILAAKVDHAIGFAKNTGRVNALAAFNNVSGPFAGNGTYIFAFDMNGINLAKPFEKDLIGKNGGNVTDIYGVSIGERKIYLAQQGGGYFYYVYNNPDTGEPEFKVSYVAPVDSRWAAGAGMYLPDVPATFSSEQRNKLVSRVHEAAAYVKENGRDAAVREFNNPNGSFSQPDLFVFAFDRNGTLLANHYLPGIVGVNRLSDRDPYGEYPVPYILKNAEDGGGFLYYFFADPATDYRVRLKFGYSQLAGNDLVVGAGIFSDRK
ncbi:MAG: cache domain-containing protein [Methanoregula sp.]